MQRAERIPKDFRGTADKCQIIYTALTKLRTAKNFRNMNKAPTMFTTIEYPRHHTSKPIARFARRSRATAPA